MGCSSLRLNPVTEELRQVYPSGPITSTITVLKGQTFFDSKIKVYSVTVAPGVFVLDSQDDSCWYYRAPTAMQRSIYDSGKLVDTNLFPGGLAIGKRTGMLFPAAVYKSDGSMDRTLIWKFGGEFMRQEGTLWKRDDHACDPK
ncbi:MAG TPA: hypothetical protein PKI32_04250 [Opitutales bacterium]|nr:hypothetical protein [Opitutales bacterium]